MTVNPKAAFDSMSATEYNELVRLAQPLFVRSAGTDTYALTTPMHSHASLTLTPDINSTYTFTSWLIVTAPAAQDFKMQWLTPSGAAGWWTVKNQALAAGGGTVYQSPLTWPSSATLEGAGADIVMEIFGVLRTAGTPGALTLQYAPNTAGTVTVQVDSTMELRKR
jgi:hypothetical protein